LFLSGDVKEVENILPVIQRVTEGNGLDVTRVKDLLQKYIDPNLYEEHSPEIDRAIRWCSVLLGPMAAPQPYVEANYPLSQIPKYAKLFKSILSAKELYGTLNEKRQLPLDVVFSNKVSRLAPYMSFCQVEYILTHRNRFDWQAVDLRRLRYVYSVKKKVLDINESYGGLSFLPQSFFMSVFVGEATRASLRARVPKDNKESVPGQIKRSTSTIGLLRNRLGNLGEWNEMTFKNKTESNMLSPAQIAMIRSQQKRSVVNTDKSNVPSFTEDDAASYELGDSLLGPCDVAILLQAGLTSSLKSSTVVQLNQRMLIDLIASQPNSFAVAVLAEIGTPGGDGSPRSLASALMALLELDQSSFIPENQLNMHSLLEKWLQGYKMPRREDYLAGGRWARQSYYDAIFLVAEQILADAEVYFALKNHIQHVRHSTESDDIPQPKELQISRIIESNNDQGVTAEYKESKVMKAVGLAKQRILEADEAGQEAIKELREGESTKWKGERGKACQRAIEFYFKAFDACSKLLDVDKLAFQLDWFKDFWRRNYDALMVKSLYDNVDSNIDHVREWLDLLKKGGEGLSSDPQYFQKSDKHEQDILDEIINAIFFDEKERTFIQADPLVRLLISNPPGLYDFTIISAMGVITEGEKGEELAAAFERLKEKRGVEVIRANTGTARSLEYNAGKIEEAIQLALSKEKKPYGLLGYSQGCANSLTAESMLISGTPLQQEYSKYLVCRQLLFSAANGSMHGVALNIKIPKLIVMCEEAFKYHQGYFSRACIRFVLEALNDMMDSSAFQKFLGGAQSLLPEGCCTFWREAQNKIDVPTCVLRGVLEHHTTPESLEMVSHLLTKQSGSELHDSQVHVYDAVGHPKYLKNRNRDVMLSCDMGGSIQRTHHWSPLEEEVEYVSTTKDKTNFVFHCAKDRHIFPWVDVNARFGVIKYVSDSIGEGEKK